MKGKTWAPGLLLALSLAAAANAADNASNSGCKAFRVDADAVNSGRMTCDSALTMPGANAIDGDLQKYVHDMGLGKVARGEQCLAIAAATGKSVWLGASSDRRYCDNKPANQWPDQQARTIRASVLAWLLTDAAVSKHLTRKGIDIGGAAIDGSLDLQYADILSVLHLRNCILKEVKLGNAVSRTIDLSGSRIASFNGTRLTVDGDLNLETISTPGSVDLTDSTINGTLHAGDAQLRNPGDSLILASARIGESANFGRTYSNGVIRITRATIKQDLNFGNAIFSDGRNGLKAGYAIVKGNFWWTPARIGKRTELDLIGASVGTFHNSDDQNPSWPVKNCLFLHGFEFSRIAAESPTDEPTLKKWLDRQPDRAHDVQSSKNPHDWCDTYQSGDPAAPRVSHPDSQPFGQLAKVLQNSGKADDATELLIDKAQEDLDAEQATSPRNPKTLVLWLWGKVACFGYDPLHTVRFIVFFVLFGWAAFWLGSYYGLIVPTDKDAFKDYVTGDDSKSGRHTPDHYQLFNSFFFSLETFLPLVDLFQAKNWLPNPQRKPQWASRMLRGYLWIHIIAGWFFTTALLAGLSGLFHK